MKIHIKQITHVHYSIVRVTDKFDPPKEPYRRYSDKEWRVWANSDARGKYVWMWIQDNKLIKKLEAAYQKKLRADAKDAYVKKKGTP